MFAFLQHEISQAREASGERAGTNGAGRGLRLWRHRATICCMFALLQHETSQGREASDEGASGAGRRFEACGVTRSSSPACSHSCNTRHRRRARRQMIKPALAGQGAGSRPVDSHGVHVLHVDQGRDQFLR
eukprot:scaffold42308_cov63-Phaeocystis_antarctica.AAC.1